MAQFSEVDVQECIEAARRNSKDSVLRCSRCGTEIEPHQDCSECQKKWEFWVKDHLDPIIEERRQREMEEIVATSDTSKICFDLSEDECV